MAPAGREFHLIRLFVSAFETRPAPMGPGDDCAVVHTKARARDLCITTDSVVEGVHFSLRTFRLEDVGYKALAVNLSDLAAMGARPAWFVCALALPSAIADRDVSQLAWGMSGLAREHRIALVGGNVTSSQQLSVTITAAGEAAPGHALIRGGARPGDWLYVSGTLGDARLGLMQLRQAKRGAARMRQLRPIPRVQLGRLAAQFANAAIDVSDGFAQDLAHLCHASRVGAQVNAEWLPLTDELRRQGRQRAIDWALGGGEDYELVLAVPPHRAASFERACRQIRERVTRVGEVTPGTQVRIFMNGKRIPSPKGFDHFRSSAQRG